MTIYMDEFEIEDEIYSFLDDYKVEYGKLYIQKAEVSVEDDEYVVVDLYGSIIMTLHNLMSNEPDGSTNSVVEGFFEAQEFLYDYGAKSNKFNSAIDSVWADIQRDEDTLLSRVSDRMFDLADDLAVGLRGNKNISDGDVEFLINFGHMDYEISDFTKEDFKNLVINRS